MNYGVELIVVGLHLRWRGVWQRPNHVLSRLAAHVDVIVVEESFAAARDALHVERLCRITVLTPERVRVAPGVDADTIAAVRTLARDRSAVVWLYSPLMLDLAAAVPGAPLVYDKMDELASFKDADPMLARREREVCERAAFAFAGGRSLWNGIKERVRDGAAFASGVDVEHYARASRSVRNATSKRRGPVFGYIGVLDERIDVELIAATARARPDATLVFVGPVAKIDPRTLPQAPNIRYLGKRTYDELPELVAGFDVAMMPFALNEATASISPTKTLEYLAARRPVVSTAVADVVAEFSEVVYVARTPDEFLEALARAERVDEARLDAGSARAAGMTWDAIVDAMRGALSRAGIVIGPLPASERPDGAGLSGSLTAS